MLATRTEQSHMHPGLQHALVRKFSTAVARASRCQLDPTLTVDRVVRVMEKVTSDEETRKMVWMEVLCWEDIYGEESTPYSYINEVYEEKRLADIYVNSHPESSWEQLVKDLYYNGEMAAAKEAKSFLKRKDPTLTVDKVVGVMENVTPDEETKKMVWVKLLCKEDNYDEESTPYSYINKVYLKYTTDDQKTKDLAEVYVNSHPESSWKQLIQVLFIKSEMAAAKEVKSFLGRKDPTLTVDRVVRVMEKVTSDKDTKKMVWVKVLCWEDIYCKESTLYSYVNKVYIKNTTDKEKIKDLADVYVNSHPEPSWKQLVQVLFIKSEMAAAKEAKSFLGRKDPTLTVDRVVEVMEKVVPDEDTRKMVWVKVLCWEDIYCKESTPYSYINEVYIKNTTDKQKTTALAKVYVDIHPASSWEHLVKNLNETSQQAAAEKAESFLQQSGTTDTCLSDSLSQDGSSQPQPIHFGGPSTSGHVHDEQGESSEDPSIPPPAKRRKTLHPQSNGVSSDSEERLRVAPHLAHQLTLDTIKRLRSASHGHHKINVIKHLASDNQWMELGDLLAFDDCGKKVDEIQIMHPNNPEACCRAMFQHWIRGNSKVPCTWSNLIELLRDCDQEYLAYEIETALDV